RPDQCPLWPTLRSRVGHARYVPVNYLPPPKKPACDGFRSVALGLRRRGTGAALGRLACNDRRHAAEGRAEGKTLRMMRLSWAGHRKGLRCCFLLLDTAEIQQNDCHYDSIWHCRSVAF